MGSEMCIRDSDMQVQQLDGIAKQAQEQVDLLTGIKSTGQSSLEALNALLSAISALPNGGKTPGFESTGSTDKTLLEGLYSSVLGRKSDASGMEFWLQKMKEGVSYADVTKAFYSSDEYTGKTKAKIPGYAAGGDHMGGYRVVGEVGAELEATGPSRIFNAKQTASIPGGGDMDEALLERVEELLVEMRKANTSLNRTADATEGSNSTLDAATKGGRPIKMQQVN